MDIIQVKNYSFSYEGNIEEEILHQMNFSIEEGTITAIIGLSGCGKTTLCHAICGLIPHCIPGRSTGEILVKGRNTENVKLNLLAQTIGLVMQNPDEQLVTTTVEDELAFGPENLDLPKEIILERVESALKFFGIGELRMANPNKLSGGQKHLVAMGCVSTLNPEIFVLDEPMSHLDDKGKDLVKAALKNLREKGKTILVVEHDFMTMDFADKWLVLSKGNRVAYDAPAKLLESKELLTRENLVW